MWWRYHLINSADMSHIGELKQARGRSLQTILNRAGSASFTYPMDEPLYAHRIAPYKTGIVASRYNWRASLALGRSVWENKWSGYVLPIDQQVSENRMIVNCVGWLNRLERRFLREEVNYVYSAGVGVDDADILFDLLDRMNDPNAPDGYVFTYMDGSSDLTLMSVGSKLPNEGVGGATAYAPAYRGQNYSKHQQILAAFNDLTNTENGCDIHVDPDTRELNCYRKRQRIKRGIKFGFQRWPNNVQIFGNPIDSEKTVNYFVAYGSPLSTPKYQDDTDSMAQFGPLEEVATLSDVVDPVPPAPSVLQYYAATEVAFRAFPPHTFSITPFVYTPGGSVPEPFVDYHEGDLLNFNAKHLPRIDYEDVDVRVFGIGINIDDNGAERLQALNLYPE